MPSSSALVRKSSVPSEPFTQFSVKRLRKVSMVEPYVFESCVRSRRCSVIERMDSSSSLESRGFRR